MTSRHTEEMKNFNPRTPCGMRRKYFNKTILISPISIHAPHVGCDMSISDIKKLLNDFNPRTPCGMRRNESVINEETITNFNPRTPCGMRLIQKTS